MTTARSHTVGSSGFSFSTGEKPERVPAQTLPQHDVASTVARAPEYAPLVGAVPDASNQIHPNDSVAVRGNAEALVTLTTSSMTIDMPPECRVTTTNDDKVAPSTAATTEPSVAPTWVAPAAERVPTNRDNSFKSDAIPTPAVEPVRRGDAMRAPPRDPSAALRRVMAASLPHSSMLARSAAVELSGPTQIVRASRVCCLMYGPVAQHVQCHPFLCLNMHLQGASHIVLPMAAIPARLIERIPASRRSDTTVKTSSSSGHGHSTGALRGPHKNVATGHFLETAQVRNTTAAPLHSPDTCDESAKAVAAAASAAAVNASLSAQLLHMAATVNTAIALSSDINKVAHTWLESLAVLAEERNNVRCAIGSCIDRTTPSHETLSRRTALGIAAALAGAIHPLLEVSAEQKTLAATVGTLASVMPSLHGAAGDDIQMTKRKLLPPEQLSELLHACKVVGARPGIRSFVLKAGSALHELAAGLDAPLVHQVPTDNADCDVIMAPLQGTAEHSEGVVLMA